MDQVENAELFASLHVKGSPLVLYNAWDAGSANAICEAGAPAIATSSWAVAAAHGYPDGEQIPLKLVEQIVARIAATVGAPLSVDLEGGYSEDDDALASTVGRLIDAGVIGINFEDRVVSGRGLHSVEEQSRRIAAIRHAAQARRIPFFINARTDLFLDPEADPTTLVGAAVERAAAYAEAGASGFFVPGLRDDALIRQICETSTLPVNVMIIDGLPEKPRLAELGVARISYGPQSFISALGTLRQAAESVYSGP